jgi:hypothetical protein
LEISDVVINVYENRSEFNKKLKKENDLRNVFFSELGQVRTLAEKANTGGTSVGVGMYDRLKNYFANENDSMAVLKAKLDFSLKEIEKADKEARISSEYGIDYEIEEEANGSPTQEIIDENDLGDL